MPKRGRKSMADLAITPTSLGPVMRPDAPYDVTTEEAEEWWAITNRMPAEWFPRETHALLTNFCRHVVTARRISQLISVTETAEHLDIEMYDRLLRMRERESRAASSLATRLRMTQQSTIDLRTQKPVLPPAPWLGVPK
jgi:hypothetical protein